MEDTILIVKRHADDMLSSMGFDGESIIAQENNTIIVNIEVDTPALLIGRGGEGLESFQHLLRLLAVEASLSRDYDIVVDIAGYRKKKASHLQREAKEKAYQVLATGLPEIFPPMSAYERRIVHMVCSNIADVETESEGEGKHKRVVIKPKKL